MIPRETLKTEVNYLALWVAKIIEFWSAEQTQKSYWVK